MAKYKIEVTEEQARVIQKSLEEYFRLRLGQCWDFTDEFCMMNCDLSADNPNHDKIFDAFIARRNAMREVMNSAFRIGYGARGYLEEKTDDMLIAEDLWDSIRFARGKSRWDSPLHLGSEPAAKIEKID